ncbi:MAG: glucoamylase family protein, partial [Bacteroidota bacterium]
LSLLACSLLFFKVGGQDFSLQADGYDSHVELRWDAPAGSQPNSYHILSSTDGNQFFSLNTVSSKLFLDFTGFAGDSPDTYFYFVEALNGAGAVIGISDTVAAVVQKLSDEDLLDMVQRYTFRYFWDFAHPVSGMARERNTSGDIVTSGGTGFGIMAILVGVERGYISREEGLNHLLKIATFLQMADKFHGVFPHWMNGVTGDVFPFSQFDNGGDLVETAFLMQGLLCARQYFDENDPLEEALRLTITSLWESVDWNFYRKNNSPVLYWHWSPNFGWQINFQLRGFNEAMIVYILAIASPTHPVPASLWNTGWTAQGYANGNTWYGYKLDVGPPLGGPLFFAHYSFLGFDPRNKKDQFTNYFLRNRNHTLVNRAYCIDNPGNHEHYSEVCWGLTASDDPFGYLAHEAIFAKDNGTITPTAALSSMPYTPAESLAALK